MEAWPSCCTVLDKWLTVSGLLLTREAPALQTLITPSTGLLPEAEAPSAWGCLGKEPDPQGPAIEQRMHTSRAAFWLALRSAPESRDESEVRARGCAGGGGERRTPPEAAL